MSVPLAFERVGQWVENALVSWFSAGSGTMVIFSGVVTAGFPLVIIGRVSENSKTRS